jgi:hypothetical protein
MRSDIRMIYLLLSHVRNVIYDNVRRRRCHLMERDDEDKTTKTVMATWYHDDYIWRDNNYNCSTR